MKAIAAIMLTIAVAFAAGCKPEEEPNNGGGGNNGGGNNGGGGTTDSLPTDMYLGIIGFNTDLTIKPISRLNNQTIDLFKTFITGLQMGDATILIEAVNTSLDKITSCGIPKELVNVSIINFTDGMDEGSVRYSNLNRGTNYSSESEYLEVVRQRIGNVVIAGIPLQVHTIGIQGNDVYDVDLFRNTLNGISSLPSDEYMHFVTDLSQVQAYFREIAENLHQTSINSVLTMRFPAPNNDNTRLRFTFDDPVDDALQSQQYIEGVYVTGSDGTGVLTNVQYVGLSSTSGNTVTADAMDGIKAVFKFENMKDSDNNNFTTSNVTHVRKWTKINETTWVNQHEWESNGNTEVHDKYYSSLVILNLDCSMSLGDDAFRQLKTYAKAFVDELKPDEHE